MSRPSRRSFRPQSRTPAADAVARSGSGPTQRQLRAGELVRHALVEILREEALADPVLAEVSVTLTEVRMSPDLRHALCFVVPLGGGHAPEVVAGLNRAARLLRGRLGRAVDLKFTPDLKFVRDDSFDEAERMRRLFDDPKVRHDLERHADDEAEAEDDDGA
jgi:ribosome-binding factor A